MDVKELKKEFINDTEIITKKFEGWAQQIGNKTFLYYGEEEQYVSYADFNNISNAIAHNLLNLGIKKGDTVSLFLKNPLITIMAMFGIWKAGAVFCPINFNYFGRLLSYQINEINPKLFIIETDMVPKINDIAAEIPKLNTFIYKPQKEGHDYNSETAWVELDSKLPRYKFEELLKGTTKNLDQEIEYYDIANIMYTSGTTGPAKGVIQSHRWLNQYTFNPRQLVNHEDVVYNDLPLYHVGGAFANVVMGAWVGCTIALWNKFSTNDYWRRINACGASKAILMSVMIPRLMNAKKTPEDRFNPLKQIHMQPLPQNHHNFAKRFGIDFITCGYGQTEAGGGFLGIFDELEKGEGTPPELCKGYSRDEIKARAKKYGFPVHKGTALLPKGFMGKSPTLLQATILNEHDEECELGQCGELAFRPIFPSSIMNCYSGNPEATLKVFRNLWFHTGDSCIKDQDGNFYFVDRIGEFIRTKGENISSYQIEDIVNNHELVEVCAAFPIPAEEGGEDDIVLYVVAKSGEYINDQKIKEWIYREMPKFMWPTHIKIVDDLPKTQTNKIEKYKLKEDILKELRRK